MRSRVDMLYPLWGLSSGSNFGWLDQGSTKCLLKCVVAVSRSLIAVLEEWHPRHDAVETGGPLAGNLKGSHFNSLVSRAQEDSTCDTMSSRLPPEKGRL